MSEDYDDENKKHLSQWLTDEQLQKMTAREVKVFRERLLQGLEEMGIVKTI